MQRLQKLVDGNPKFKSNRIDWLKLKDTGKHQVVLIGCENATGKDYQTQQPIQGVNLLFEEEGIPKKYFVSILGKDGKFHYLIERFADIKEGTKLVLEYQRKPGSVQGFIRVQVVGEGEGTDIVDDGEIPIIEDQNKDGTSKTDIETELDIDLES